RFELLEHRALAGDEDGRLLGEAENSRPPSYPPDAVTSMNHQMKRQSGRRDETDFPLISAVREEGCPRGCGNELAQGYTRAALADEKFVPVVAAPRRNELPTRKRGAPIPTLGLVFGKPVNSYPDGPRRGTRAESGASPAVLTVQVEQAY